MRSHSRPLQSLGTTEARGLPTPLRCSSPSGSHTALLEPERITHCVALSVGWGSNDPDQRLSLKQIQNYWYHWYLALDRGEVLLRKERFDFTR
jgi:hypothetical protein